MPTTNPLQANAFLVGSIIMTHLLIKKKDGTYYIRKKSLECAGNAENVHPNKLKAWAKFGRAAQKAQGGIMEDVIQSVIDEMKGIPIKSPKPKIEISEQDYQDLVTQALKKNIPINTLNQLVVVVPKKSPVEEIIEQVLLK